MRFAALALRLAGLTPGLTLASDATAFRDVLLAAFFVPTRLGLLAAVCFGRTPLPATFPACFADFFAIGVCSARNEPAA
ncbi:MAG: hypothetical protein JOY90_22625 [Bradyrhizobium sp.]|uniref:hypothetical protein n=1 Tax=Bradyrhizobium sp. TaxID=376 RepID=UPI001D9E9D10|nr:hypothetical protein [Bradyrhizobium sp.]MBV9563213.1 hypothetical protein [Bradyrhizobium sp.]